MFTRQLGIIQAEAHQANRTFGFVPRGSRGVHEPLMVHGHGLPHDCKPGTNKQLVCLG